MQRLESWLAGETRPSLLAGIAAAAIAVGACTLLIYPLKSSLDPLSLDVVYIPAILLVAAGWGAALGIATTLASLVAFDFFHVPPTLEFTLGSDAAACASRASGSAPDSSREPGLWRLPTRSAGASCETCTTAPSSGWCTP
jgi:hypothetical protein